MPDEKTLNLFITIIQIGGLLAIALILMNKMIDLIASQQKRNDEIAKRLADNNDLLTKNNSATTGALDTVSSATRLMADEIALTRKAIEGDKTSNEEQTKAIQALQATTSQGIVRLEQNTQAVDALRSETSIAHNEQSHKLAAIEEIGKRIDALPGQVDSLQKQITPIFEEVTEIAAGIKALLDSGKAQTELAENLGRRLEGIENKLITFIEKVAPAPETKPSPETPGMAPTN